MKNLLLLTTVFLLGLLVGQFVSLTDEAEGNPTSAQLKADIARLTNQLADQQLTKARLQARLHELEQTNISSSPQAEASSPENADDGSLAQEIAEPVVRPEQEEQQIQAILRQLGVGDDELRQMNDRIDSIRLAHLNLRNQALREEWYGTQRYYNTVRQQANEQTIYRDLLGRERYDKFLFLSGQPNRVGVRSVMKGSVAEQIGLKPGDVILSYGEQKVFDWAELSQATVQGTAGEQVRVELRREGETINVYAPRGPLGVMLSSLSEQP